MPSYAHDGPPFKFSGTLTESQKGGLEKWVEDKQKHFEPISVFHQVRAHQLRKAAGLLEAFHAKQGLGPSLNKDPWQPGADGHFLTTPRDDQGPGNAVGAIKDRMQSIMALADTAQFRMNFLRARLEAHEDMAQEAVEGAAYVSQKLQDLNRFFADPHYRAVCIRESDTYEGEPRFRVHPLDPPTAWEKRMARQELLDP